MNYKGRSLQSLGILVVGCWGLLAGCQVAPPPAIVSSPTLPSPDRLSQLEVALTQQVNQYRQARQLTPLLPSDYLSQQARIHSERMASGLVPFDGRDFEARKTAVAQVIPFQSLGVSFAQLGDRSNLTTQILKAWTDNPQNRQQLTGNFDLIGIGIVQNAQGVYYITQLFLKQPSPSPSTAQNPSITAAPPTLPPPLLSSLEQEIFQAVNRYRQSRQLPPLKFNARISAIARQHAQAMAKKEATFSHDGFDQRVAQLKSTLPIQGVGENLAFIKGYPNLVETAVQGWIDSPGHRKTMEGNYDLTGIGIAKNLEGEYYFSQLFVLEP